MKHIERLNEMGQLSLAEQVAQARRPPTEVALGREKGFHDEKAARRYAHQHRGHQCPVKIIEYQNRIKDAELRPRLLEIHPMPIDREPSLRGELSSRLQTRWVPVERHDVRSERRRRKCVASFAAGYVKHSRARADAVSMPGEPGTRAGQLVGGGQGHGGLSWRRAELASSEASPAELLVIGGGITGAGIARDAAMRGIRTVLLEQHDLGSGTSSKSSRLVHGGLRYLEQGNLRLVFEANRERATLLRIAPHLVRPLPFVFPVHRGGRVPLWRLAVGMWLYDALALFRNVRRHRMLGKREMLDAEPTLRERGLLGGALYYDAQCDDARLVLATARSAIMHGASVANYAAVRRLIVENGRVSGVEAEDRLTGVTANIRALVVVNATGPWHDVLRKLEDPGAAPMLRLTRGAHLMVPRGRLGHQRAVTFLSPLDGRVMFVLPWGDLSYIGTTDTDTLESPDEVRATIDDVVYLLRSANARFPGAHLTVEDVRGTWAGLRALLGENGVRRPSSVSREHLIAEGPAGMISIAGGKLTTYRSMAAEVVSRVVRRLQAMDGRRRPAEARTDREPLPGGEAPDLDPFRERGLESGLPRDTVDHLVAQYGTEAAGIYNLARGDRRLGQRLHPKHPAIEAEVVHAARRELAQTVEDVLVRRIHLYFEAPDQGVGAARRVAELLATELGWNAERVTGETDRYVQFVGGSGPLSLG